MGSGYVDLHCHYVPGIDDGVRNEEESLALLKGLRLIGYTEVVATPHMRPGMFDNTKEKIESAFEGIAIKLEGEEIPRLSLGAEHFFDEVFLERLERKDV
ncbi:MAG: protein tyrosine phosphatase, partial [Sandaracinaceae bacterium]|nr:protein tyrosine phosphatase [Sandaracinaceae bacterium]